MASPYKLLQKFSSLYSVTTGHDYVPSLGRDLKLFKDLIKAVSEEDLIKRMLIFFDTEQKSYTVPWFKAVFNDLVIKEKPRQRLINPDSWRFTV